MVIRYALFDLQYVLSALLLAHPDPLPFLIVFGLARRGSTVGFHLLWHAVELAMGARLCLL